MGNDNKTFRALVHCDNCGHHDYHRLSTRRYSIDMGEHSVVPANGRMGRKLCCSSKSAIFHNLEVA